MPALPADLLHILIHYLGACAGKLSGRRPAPPELHALALGDEEQVVAQRVYVFVVEGHDAEAAVAVGPDERRRVAHERGLGNHTPAVGERQAMPREVEGYPPTLVGGDLEVAGEPAGGDHALLEVLREGPLVRLDPGEILGVVHQPRRRWDVRATLCDHDSLRRIEADERDRRAPEVLYHPERYVASPPRVPDRLGEARSGEAHVFRLPRMRLAHGPQPATTAAYAADLFHDARILQPTPRWRSPPTKKAGHAPRPSLLDLRTSLLAAQRQQVKQRKQRGERGRDVGEGSRREHPLRAVRLGAREHTVAGEET